MKSTLLHPTRSFAKRFFSVLSASTVFAWLSGSPAFATYYWNSTGTSTWNAATSWSSSSNGVGNAGFGPGAADTAVFNGSSFQGNTTVQLAANQAVGLITFSNTGTTLLESNSGTAYNLTIAGGIGQSGSPGAVTIGNAANPLNVLISGTQAWGVNTSLTVNSNIASSATTGTQTLSITTAGTNVINGNISNGTAGGTLALTIGGTGSVTLAGANSYTGLTSFAGGSGHVIISGTNSSAGTTTISAGTVELDNASDGGLASGTLTMSAGALQSLLANQGVSNAILVTGATTISGSNNISLNGGVTNSGGNNSIASSITAPAGLTIGNLYLSEAQGTARTFTLTGTGNTTLNSVADSAAGSASSGTSGLTIASTGTTTLAGANPNFTGTLAIAGTGGNTATLDVTSSSALSAAGAVTMAAKSGFNYIASSDTQLVLGSTLALTGSGSFIGGSLGSTGTSAEINVTGAATATSSFHVDIYNNLGLGTGGVTYTLIQGGAGSTLSSGSYPVGSMNVYDNTNFTVGAPVATTTTLKVTTTAATALTTAYWKSGGNTATGLGTTWAVSNGSTLSNWSTTSGGSAQGLIPGSGAAVIFATNSTTATTLGAPVSIKSLALNDTSANAFTLGADGNSLTIGTGGISVASGVATTSTIAAPVVLNGGQTWANASANGLSVTGGIAGTGSLITQANGAGAVTLGTSVNNTGTITNSGSGAGATTISGAIGSNVTGVTENSSTSALILSGINTYGSATSVQAGNLTVTGSLGSGSAVTVGNNTAVATLSGTGTIGGSLTTASTGSNVAHLAAGVNTSGNFGSVGTLIVGGAVTIGSGTALDFDLSGSSTSLASNDLISMTGTGANGVLTLSGTGIKLNVNASNLLTGAGNAYTLISGISTSNVSGISLGNISLGTITGGASTSDTATFELVTGATDSLEVYFSPVSANSSVLNLPASSLAINMRTGSSGTPGSTTVTETSGVSSGHFTPTSTGANALTLSPSTSTAVAAGGSTTLNAGWSSTTTAGSRSGQITIVNNDNSGDTAGTKTQTVTGGVYDYANPTYTGKTVAFGNVRVGATAPTGTLAISNTTISNASYQDNLTATASTGNSHVTATGITELAAGTTGTITLTGNTATAGSLASTETLGLTSTSTVSGLDSKSITPTGGTVTTTGAVWDYANPTYTGTTLAFGYLHVGATATEGLNIGNSTITNASYQDNLTASATTSNSNVSASGFSEQAAGSFGTVTFTANTTAAGSLASTDTLTLTSTSTKSGLDSKVITPTGGAVTTSGTVYSGLSSWISASSGSWGTITGATPDSAFLNNWDQGAPGVTAGFTGVDTATFGAQTSGAITVSLNNASPNLNKITFSSPDTAYTIAPGSGSSTGITLSQGNGAPLPSINVTNPSSSATAGTQTISTPITVGANTSVNVAAKQTLDLTGVISGTSANSMTYTGPGTTVVTANNGYSGGTAITGGTLYVNNTGGASYTAPATSSNRTISATNSGSGTGTGEVTVGNGATLAGSGTIAATSGGIEVHSGGVLSSGAIQTGTSAGQGLTINNAANLSSALVVDGGATLTFALGSTTGYNGGSGANNFAAPNTNSTYLSLTGMTVDQIFSDTTSAAPDTIKLVDLTAGSSSVALTLRSANPYLLIQTDLGNNADFANLVTTGGLGGNGYVLGVSNGTGGYTAFNISAYDINNNQINTSSNLEGMQLYLYNGDLEVVPEPGTWALMIGGLALLVVVQRRKHKLG